MAEESITAAPSSEEGEAELDESAAVKVRPRLTELPIAVWVRSGTLTFLREREQRRVRDPLPKRLLKYLRLRRRPMQLPPRPRD